MDESKSDWVLYRERIGIWQERYMERLCREYCEMLQKDKPATDRFWALQKRINKDKNTPGVAVTLRRSNMFYDILGLIKDGAISVEDLKDFSQDLQDKVMLIIRQRTLWIIILCTHKFSLFIESPLSSFLYHVLP